MDIEKEIQLKGLNAPRVTMELIESQIAAEYFFTAATGTRQVSDAQINRFLSWKLPKHFSPDANIKFTPSPSQSHERNWPVGTNLLNADEAKEMLTHVLQPAPIHPALNCLTFCVLVMNNGFTVTGESACASPENFDAELGRKIARQNAVSKLWPLLGYELRTKLTRARAEHERLQILENSNGEG